MDIKQVLTVPIIHRYEKKVENLKKKLQNSEPKPESTDMTQLQEALKELERKGQELIDHEKELEKKDRVSNFSLSLFLSI